MSIASAITAAQGKVADCYTAISNKGGTLPATQNLSNMPTAIGSIPSGSSELPSYQVSSGVASRRSGALTGNEFSSITSIGDTGFYYAFANCGQLTGSVVFSSLTSVGTSGLYSAFQNCQNISGLVDLSSLTTVNDNGLRGAFSGCYRITGVDLSSLTSTNQQGFYQAFYFCSKLTSVDVSSLESIGGMGFYSAFYYCSALTSVSFDALDTLTEQRCLEQAFRNCPSLQSLYFPSLTTSSFGQTYIDQFNNIFNSSTASTSGTCTIHFPSNVQSTISGLTGYPLFGGTSGRIVLAFDLTATS